MARRVMERRGMQWVIVAVLLIDGLTHGAPWREGGQRGEAGSCCAGRKFPPRELREEQTFDMVNL